MSRHPVFRVHVPAKPVAKGRPKFSRQTGRAYTPKQTVVAESWVRMCCVQQVGTPRVEGPVTVRILFVLPVPKSRPAAWKADALAGLVAPTSGVDWDNCAKLASDALNGVAWRDDAEVTIAGVAKVYGPAPCTVIAWWQLTPQEVAAERMRALAEVQGWEAVPAAAGALL